MSERKLRRMSRTELIDVIDTLRQDETPQDTEALRRVDAERKRLTERRRFWRVLRGTVSTLIVVAAIAVLLATLLLPVLQVSGDSMNPTLQDRDVILLVKRTIGRRATCVAFTGRTSCCSSASSAGRAMSSPSTPKVS